MSPTKSKDPRPAKKNTRAKTPQAKTKPPATSAKRKVSKTLAHVDKTDAVTDGLTNADSAMPGKPAKQSVPKVSRAKAKESSTAGPHPTSPVAKSSATGEGRVADPHLTLGNTGRGHASPVAKSTATGEGRGDSGIATGTAIGEGRGDSPDAQGAAAGGLPPAASNPKMIVDMAPAPNTESEQVAEAPEPTPPSVPTAPAAQAADEPLDFPKGALIAFRKSGGLIFSSREIVVYPDGRVTYGGGDTAKSALTRAARRMSDAQVMRLRRTLDQINFFGMRPPKIQPDPDGFVIEIAARLGGKNNQLEVNAADMRGALNSLVDQLTILLPSEE